MSAAALSLLRNIERGFILPTLIDELKHDAKISMYGARLYPNQVIASSFHTDRIAVSLSRTSSDIPWTIDLSSSQYDGSSNDFFDSNAMKRLL